MILLSKIKLQPPDFKWVAQVSRESATLFGQSTPFFHFPLDLPLLPLRAAFAHRSAARTGRFVFKILSVVGFL